MTPNTFLRVAVAPALFLLPAHMDSTEAKALILAIAMQESRLAHRRQIHGPARSYLQFERAGIDGVLSHAATKTGALGICLELDVAADVDGVYAAIEFNDLLAAAFARLLLWTVRGALPGPRDASLGWLVYLEAWRPGKPRRESWDDFYQAAWTTLLGRSVSRTLNT